MMHEGNIKKSLGKVETINKTVVLFEVFNIMGAAACQCLKKKCVSPHVNPHDDQSV